MEVTTDRQEDCSSASSHSATERLLSRDGRGAEAERQRGREAGQGRATQGKAERTKGKAQGKRAKGGRWSRLRADRQEEEEEEQGTQKSL